MISFSIHIMGDNQYFDQLTEDLIIKILVKLPAKTLLFMRCVSKSFDTLISRPSFIKFHLLCMVPAAASCLLNYDFRRESCFYVYVDKNCSMGNSFIPPPPFEQLLVGSSMGIVCLSSNSFTLSASAHTILWNPLIRKSIKVPHIEWSHDFRKHHSHITVGFGFDHRAFDFKVVKIVYQYNINDLNVFVSKAFIYGMQIGTWKNIGSEAPCFVPEDTCFSVPVFVNGTVHWLANRPAIISSLPNCIMAFDLVAEVFKLLELPQYLEPHCHQLRLFPTTDEKSIALFVTYEEDAFKKWDVWLMNDCDAKVESWTRKYIVDLGRVFHPLQIVNDYQILAKRIDRYLILIDVEDCQVNWIGGCGLYESCYSIGYTPSLALLTSE